MGYVFIFIFGSIVGSFLNVCIYRMPRGESIVLPPSRCPSCKKSIEWRDNIPFLSYILLKGKCRKCGDKISPRYFIVELITAITFLVLYVNFGISFRFWIYSLVTFSLIIISFIDLEFQVIPDTISIGGIFLGIAFSIILPRLHYVSTWKASLLDSFLGVFVGGGLLYLTGILGKLAFKKDSMGGGDVKLLAMLGAFLGWKLAIFIFFLAPFFGAPVGIYSKFIKKEDLIPYGPFISLASFFVMIFGGRILYWL